MIKYIGFIQTPEHWPVKASKRNSWALESAEGV